MSDETTDRQATPYLADPYAAENLQLIRNVSMILLAVAILGLAWDTYVMLYHVPRMKDIYADMGSKLSGLTLILVSIPRWGVMLVAPCLAILLIAKESFVRPHKAMPINLVACLVTVLIYGLIAYVLDLPKMYILDALKPLQH
jgi:hypothetical protein